MAETEIYYADFLKKEDLSGKWHLYWATLDATGIYFCLKKTTDENSNFEQFMEINPGSRCVLAKRHLYSFRFKLVTGQECYTLKRDSILQRRRWMYMIDLVVNGRPGESPPNTLTRVANSTDTTDYKKSSEEEDWRNQRDFQMKSSSFEKKFSFKTMRSWKKRNHTLPSTGSVKGKKMCQSKAVRKFQLAVSTPCLSFRKLSVL